MQLLDYEGFIKGQLLAIRPLRPLQIFAAMRLPRNFNPKP